MSLPNFPEQLVPKGTRILRTVSNSAIALGTTDPLDPTSTPFVLVEVQANGISARYDGTAATAADGHLLASGYREIWAAQMWNRTSVIRSGASDATLYATPLTW